MADGSSLINVGFGKIGDTLAKKIAEGIGGFARPWQTRRVAQAEADAAMIRARMDIEIDELQRRALNRFVAEETNKQLNIENITRKAIDHLTEDARPQDIENDWIANFFDKSKLISDEQVQELWAKVLAGEANTPGKYSKRTVSILASLDKSDAALFRRLCGFGWQIGNVVPMILDLENEIYRDHNISFNDIRHLVDIGLITYNHLTGFLRANCSRLYRVFYYGRPIVVEFQTDEHNALDIGHAILSKVGQELAPLTNSRPVDGFMNYVVQHWWRKGYKTCSEWPLVIER